MLQTIRVQKIRPEYVEAFQIQQATEAGVYIVHLRGTEQGEAATKAVPALKGILHVLLPHSRGTLPARSQICRGEKMARLRWSDRQR